MTVTVTVAGQAAQSVPFQSNQPPAAWRSLQVPVSNTGGDWMIAVVTWRQQAGGQGVTVHVDDDTCRNFWQPLGQPTGTSSASGVTRTAIWTAPAAYDAQYVMVAPTGTVQAIACTVLDVNGLTPWQTLSGLSAAFGTGTIASVTLAAPASQALVIAATGTDNTSNSLTWAGTSGFTALPQVSSNNGTDHTADLALNAQYFLATGSTHGEWTFTSMDYSIIMAAVLVTGTAPAQASPSWPVTVAEIALSAGPSTPADQVTWTAITPRSLQLQSVVQGAQYNLAALTSGTGAVTFDNPDGQLIAPGSGSFAGIDSGTPFRIRQVWQGGAWQVQFTGNGSTATAKIDTSPTSFPVIPGQSYTTSAWLGTSAPWPSGVTLNIEWRTSGGGLISGSASLPVTGPAATIAVASGTAPGTATQATVAIQVSGTPASSITFFAAAAPAQGLPGSLTIPAGISWAVANGATVTTLAPWTPNPLGPPQANPYGVPFSGFVQTWPQAWDKDMLRGVTTAAVADAWAYCNGNLQPILLQEILNDSPYAYWPCIDAAGSVQASNYATGNSNPLVATASKYGTSSIAQAFGQNSSALLGAQGTYLLTSSVRVQTQAGMWGQTGFNNGGTSLFDGWSLTCTDTGFPPLSGGVTTECWFQTLSPFPTTANGYPDVLIMGLTTTTGRVLFRVGLDVTSATGRLYLQSATGTYTFLGSTNYLTGTPPLTHVAVTFTQTTWTAYVNGVQAGSGSATWPPAFSYLTVNGTGNQAALVAFIGLTGAAQQIWNGYAGHVAVFAGLLTPERIMTHYQAGQIAMAGDTPDARIERLLQAGNYPGRRVILQDTGGGITPCASCQDIASQPASASIQNIASSTLPAVLAISPGGAVTYLSRGYVWNQPVRWTLGENVQAGEIPFLDDIGFAYDPLRVVDDVQLTQLDNQDIVTPQAEVAVLDAASQQQYGDQQYWVTGYLENDLLSPPGAGPGLQDLANWIGAVNARPGNRVAAVTVDASSNPAAWPLFMTAAKGDIVTVNRRPVTAPGVVLSVTGRVSQTTRDAAFSQDGTKATISLLIDIAAEENALIWDDPVKGQLTGSSLLAW